MRKPELRDFDRVGRLIELLYVATVALLLCAALVYALGGDPEWPALLGTAFMATATLMGTIVIMLLVSADLLEAVIHRLARWRKRRSKNRPSVF